MIQSAQFSILAFFREGGITRSQCLSPIYVYMYTFYIQHHYLFYLRCYTSPLFYLLNHTHQKRLIPSMYTLSFFKAMWTNVRQSWNLINSDQRHPLNNRFLNWHSHMHSVAGLNMFAGKRPSPYLGLWCKRTTYDQSIEISWKSSDLQKAKKQTYVKVLKTQSTDLKVFNFAVTGR